MKYTHFAIQQNLEQGNRYATTEVHDHKQTASLNLPTFLLIALKVWVWSRGLPSTLQIPNSFLFPLVGETHGTSGQCVSFLN